MAFVFRHTAGTLCALAVLVAFASCRSPRKVSTTAAHPPGTTATPLEAESGEELPQAIAPKETPRIPAPQASSAEIADGYQVEVVLSDLIYPTSVAFDAQGNVYVAEAGYAYGDLVAPARVWRITAGGELSVVADQLNGPVNDLLWHDGHLYVSHRGKITRVDDDGSLHDLVTGLPSFGDHHNNQLAIGPDDKLYVGQGTATNSGVVGLDNVYPYLWLTFYPDVHDIPPARVALKEETFTTPDPITVLAHTGEMVETSAAVKHLVSGSEPLLVRTGAFQPFGKAAESVPGQVKANGTILRANLDGSGLEVYAWGFRNPYGLRWHDGKLYTTDLGYDERGSRPVANAPDVVWNVRQGAWYGWPDFAAAIPVTDDRFRPTRGERPGFLLEEHPPIDAPLFTRPPHTSPMKFDFSTSAAFGFQGEMFVAEFGGGAPVTGPEEAPVGNQVVRVDPATGRVTPFFRARRDRLGPEGYEYAVTSGPKRPVEARFSPDGEALYVVDFGALVGFPAGAGPAVRPIPGTGVVWRITKKGTKPKGPPADLSTLAGRKKK